MIVVPEDIKVLESGKNRILMLLTKVKDTDKIIGYEELVSRIARLGIMPKPIKVIYVSFQLSHLGLSYTLQGDNSFNPEY